MNIERRRVDPKSLDTREKDVPDHYLDKVETPDAMDSLLDEIREEIRRRDKWSDRAGIALTVIGELFPRVSSITEILKSKTSKTMKKESFFQKIKRKLSEPSTTKGIAELIAGIGVIGLSADAIGAIIGAAICVLGAVDIVRKERRGED